MEWIINNWILLLIAVMCISMHFFGGGHGKHGKHGKKECDEYKPQSGEPDNEGKAEKKGHGCCH